MKSTVSIVIHAGQGLLIVSMTSRLFFPHTAWTVDFKLKLQSFTDCLLALRRLIDFSRESTEPRHLIFISSLSVMRSGSYYPSKH
jgi:hypothetical protein